MAKQRKYSRKPKVSWPDLDTPMDTWTYAEARGVAINPIVTGIGTHHRCISDEEWVLSCEQDAEANGLEQFFADLLHILRLTIPGYLGESAPVGDYPKRLSDEDVPLPDVSFPGDRDWSEDAWNEQMVGGVLCNPVHAGIPPFPKVVDDRTWIAANIKIVESDGLRQHLVNILYQLKKSVSAVFL